MFTYEKVLNLKTYKCPLCDYEFCMNGCNDIHKNSTCELYKAWEKENEQG
jgi:hypothetical protein